MLAQLGNFTAVTTRMAVYLVAGLLVGMVVREFVRASVASRLHDPTPRLWGRLTWDPRSWFDPFGAGLVPGLIAVLWAAGVFWSPAAYGKPAPIDPSYFRHHRRDVVLVSLAGPSATLVLAFASGFAFRAVASGGGELALVLLVLTHAFAGLTVFHLLPVPGLDGARIVALLLPPAAAQVYRNADKYLPLFVLVLLFLFGTAILGALTAALCSLATGEACIP
ncbi:MAG TPA: site-2 protease family protein [Actinomycetota bacterium]|nr:site-2 protease family protein [Actinomycetota bacterium]